MRRKRDKPPSAWALRQIAAATAQGMGALGRSADEALRRAIVPVSKPPVRFGPPKG